MTAAYRLKGLGWFGGCVVVTLGFYLVSLQVAAERKHLDQVNTRIASAQRDIRALETEFDTRANLAQLERWNGDTLALVAPTAGQFVRDEGQLASISFDAGQVGAADVQTAALVVPSLSDYTPVAQPAVVVQPVTPAPTSVQVAAVRTPARPARTIQVAAQTLRAPVVADRPRMMKASLVTVPSPRPAMTLRKAQAMAMLDSNLLSDSTLGDLLTRARTEKHGR